MKCFFPKFYRLCNESLLESIIQTIFIHFLAAVFWAFLVYMDVSKVVISQDYPAVDGFFDSNTGTVVNKTVYLFNINCFWKNRKIECQVITVFGLGCTLPFVKGKERLGQGSCQYQCLLSL